MKNEHTPGPWFWEHIPAREGQAIAVSSLKGPMVLCRYWYEEMLPDARLIAAAPDLLQAAKDALESLKRLQDTDGAYRVTNIYQLQSAIRKAVGQ
jgi:hypothetical protein